MMPNSGWIGFIEASDLVVPRQYCFKIKRPPHSTVLTYLLPLMLFKHWDFHLASPAIKQLCHFPPLRRIVADAAGASFGGAIVLRQKAIAFKNTAIMITAKKIQNERYLKPAVRGKLLVQ
jgi:hypothetical protein